jgi:DNA-directed RNA polymerase specialized sigma24 family protein
MTSVSLPDPSEDETLLRLQYAELREWLMHSLLLLHEEDRLIFTLHDYERLTTEEMKRVLGAPIQHFSVPCLSPIQPPRQPGGSSG